MCSFIQSCIVRKYRHIHVQNWKEIFIKCDVNCFKLSVKVFVKKKKSLLNCPDMQTWQLYYITRLHGIIYEKKQVGFSSLKKSWLHKVAADMGMKY